jgi:hypothetical protein
MFTPVSKKIVFSSVKEKARFPQVNPLGDSPTIQKLGLIGIVSQKLEIR